MAGRGRAGAVRAVAVGLTVLTAVGVTTMGSASAATMDVVLYYGFQPTSGDGSQAILTNDGDGSVETSVVTSNGGTVSTVSSRPGHGSAARLPAFDPSATGARSVIKVVNRTDTDVLAPGNRDFAWSTAFKVDAESSDHSRNSGDNGDNLFQRGLYNDDQFKLDVDGHQPGCRLQGSTGEAGAVRVVAPMTVTPHTWYRATCTRSGDRLAITVVAFGADGATTRSWTDSAVSNVGFGSVTWKDIATPVTIGGKLNVDGTLSGASSDQFNGVVDNPQLRIWNR